jgi:hypothetical protein
MENAFAANARAATDIADIPRSVAQNLFDAYRYFSGSGTDDDSGAALSISPDIATPRDVRQGSPTANASTFDDGNAKIFRV